MNRRHDFVEEEVPDENVLGIEVEQSVVSTELRPELSLHPTP